MQFKITHHIKKICKGRFLTAFFIMMAIYTSFAAPLEIQVDAGTTLGSSEKISNFLGIQGVPSLFDRSTPDQWAIEAWRELGLNLCDIYLFDDNNGISVSRNAQGKLELDFTNLEAQLDYVTKTLGAKQLTFMIVSIPKVLSSNPDSEDSWSYIPANYKEWDDLVYRAVLHLKDRLGYSGARYQALGEPENYCNFHGRPGRKEHDIKLLDDYVELYIWSSRAVKRADPTAKVGGPGNGTYSSEINRSFGGHSWGMDDFIQKLAIYNRQNPTMKAPLDEVVWQDYDWFNDGRISEGVKHIQSVLQANGFPPNTPQWLAGWNTDYYTEPTKTLTQRAVYIVDMIVEQLNLGEQGLDRAYLWPFERDDQFPNIAMVEIPHPERTIGGEEGTTDGAMYGERKTYPAVTKYCKRPAYAGLQMLAGMKEGQFIKTTSDNLPKGVHVMATHNKDKKCVIFIATNNSASTHEMNIHFSQLPYNSGSVTSQLKRVDQSHSVDGQGLEMGSKTSVEIKDGKLTLPIEMPPYSIAQISLEP